jgi:hypothetical protein
MQAFLDSEEKFIKFTIFPLDTGRVNNIGLNTGIFNWHDQLKKGYF